MHFMKGAAQPRTEFSIYDSAALVGCHPAMIAAFIEVEAAGSGYYPDGRLKVLPERHKVYSLLPAGKRDDAVRLGLAVPSWSPKTQYKDFRKDGGGRYEFLERVASEYGPELAADAASWGAGQLMGFNAASVGYSSALEMVAAFANSEDAQIVAIAKFLVSNNLDDEARAENCKGLCRGYNGPGQVEHYTPLLQKALSRQKARNWGQIARPVSFIMLRLGDGPHTGRTDEVMALQTALNVKGGFGLTVDGDFGPATKKAVQAFQSANVLVPDGIVGRQTWQALQ
jgi:hypothetical protein